MKQTTNTADKKKMLRRSLAVFCAVCLVMVQCFVVLPAVTGGAMAADAKLTVTGYTDRTEQTQKYTDSFDGTVKELLGKMGVTTSKIDSVSSNSYAGLSLDSRIKKDGSDYCIVETVMVPNPDNPDEDMEEEKLTPIDSIDFQMASNYTPIKELYLNDIGNVKAGKSKTLKYGKDYGVKSGDSFFKEKYPEYIEASVSGDNGTNISGESIEFTAGKAGSTVKVTIKDAVTGKPSTSKNASVVSKSLTVKPSSLTLKVGESATVTVKDDNGTVSSSNLKWSGGGEIASVKNGVITGKKKGSTTIKVKDKTSGLSATVSVTVEKTKATTTTRYTYTTRRYSGSTYRPYRPTSRSGVSGSTRSSVTTTATRPTETASTAKPSFQTMTVKEVYLNEVMPEEEVYYDEYGNPIEEDEWSEEEEGTENDFDEDGVSFPAAAGSAAMAVAACGAGIVGRVRKFHIDMGTAAVAKIAKTAADGGSKAGKEAKEAKAVKEGKAAGEAKASKENRNPLKKLRKK